MSSSVAQPSISAQMPVCSFAVTPMLVQARGIEMRIGEFRVEPKATVVPRQRLVQQALVLERDRAVEVQCSVIGAASNRFVIELNGFAAALCIAEQRPQIQIGIGEIRIERQRSPIRNLGGSLVGPFERFRPGSP